MRDARAEEGEAGGPRREPPGPTCRRCGARFSLPQDEAVVEVVLPWGETQRSLTRGANLCFTPLGPEVRRQIEAAYAGPRCRRHPEPLALHPLWPEGEARYRDCCWAFDEGLPGCEVGPHEA